MKIAIVECVMKSNSKDAHVRQAEFIRDDFIKLGHTLQNSELKNVNYKDFLIDSYEEITKRNYNEDLQKQKKWIEIIEAEKQKTFKQLEEIIIGC